MAKQVAIAAERRAGNGKGEARALRRAGRVPAVAYGSGLVPTPLSVDALELYHALHTDAGLNAVLRLEFEGEMHLALARELQRHPVRRDVLHVDFVAFDKDKPVAADVPIHLEGHAPAVDEGAVLEQQLHMLPIEVLPLEMPESVILDVSSLQVGEVLRVADIPLPAGVTSLEDLERTVVTVSMPTEEPVEPELGEGAEEGALGEALADEAVEAEATEQATPEAEEA